MELKQADISLLSGKLLRQERAIFVLINLVGHIGPIKGAAFYPYKQTESPGIIQNRQNFSIDYNHGECWSIPSGTSFTDYHLDDTKAFPADGIVALQINIGSGRSYAASLLKKDENDNVIPISELAIGVTSDPIHIHVNKGDQLKIIKDYRL
jgi:hypothetical protein